MQTFQDLIFKLSEFWAARGLRAAAAATTSRSAPAPCTPTPSCACSARSPGGWPTSSPRAGRPTAATATTRSGSASTTSSRSSSSPRRTTCSGSTCAAWRRSGIDLARARPALRGGQLGGPDARRLGRRLAGDARRHGDHPVHLLPAGRRPGAASRSARRSPTGWSASPCSSACHESIYEIDWVPRGVELRPGAAPGGGRVLEVLLRARRRRPSCSSSSTACEREARRCLEAGLVLPAYECALKCSHLFNVLDARGAVSVTERVGADEAGARPGDRPAPRSTSRAASGWASRCSRRRPGEVAKAG